MDGIQQEMEISPEEREQVLKQIETAIAENRAPQRADPGVLQAEKSGLLFPLLINLAALLLVAAGVLLLFRYFELRKENITLRRSSYLSAEGALIHTLKQETENRLQAKAEEIASIQLKLQKVDQERQDLKLQLEADLETREVQLRRKLEEDLSRERDRLVALGTSEASIAERLRELESREQGSIDRAIADYRRQLDAQVQEKERELLESQRQTQEALVQASRDRDELLSELRKQESEKSIAEQRLAELTTRLKAETLLKEEESASVDALEVQLAAKTDEIAELEEQTRAIMESDALLTRRLQARVDGLNAQLKASEAGAERLTADLQSLRTERAALSTALQKAQGAQTVTFEQGRDDALRDVMTFLRYFSGSPEDSGETENRLLALTRRDPLFRAATREIRILIAGGGSSGELASPFLFLGIVTSVASERAVIEAMVDVDVSVGSVIQIRRLSDLEREIVIAEGTVQEVRGGKIIASFKPLTSGGQLPAARDPVYVVLEED
jgi:hypothetical protein